MISLFAPKIALGIAGALLSATLMYLVNDYINIKSAYRVSQKTVEVLQSRRKVVDKLMLKVEKEQNVSYVRQNKSLLEMDKKGYITTRDGRTPDWLRNKPSHDS